MDLTVIVAYSFSEGFFFFVTLVLLFFTSIVEKIFLSNHITDQLTNQPKYRDKSLIKKIRQKEHKILASLRIADILLKTAFIYLVYSLASAFNHFEMPLGLAILTEYATSIVMLILLCELLPNKVLNYYSFLFSGLLWYPIFILDKTLSPISLLILHKTPQKHSEQTNLPDNTVNESHRTSSKEQMLKGFEKFGSTLVKEIIRPLIDVVAINKNAKLNDVLRIVIDSGYSRIPVFSDSPDNMIGILYIKDLLPNLNKDKDFQWLKLTRPPYYVPESKRINDLLKEFQINKIHMAIVVDEYGATIGIITLEDVLEELVGEITDEYDEEERTWVKINENSYLFDGKTLLNDFFKIFGLAEELFDPVKGNAESLAGLLIELNGEMPAKGDIINHKPFVFKIESVDNLRIKQIRVSCEPKPSELS